jgi:hypothetical protein
MFLVVTFIAGAAVDAATLKLFDPEDRYQIPGSPLAEFNPDANNFLVVSADAGKALSRRTGLGHDRGAPWMLPQKRLARNIWGLDYLAISRESGAYLGLAGNSYFFLSRRGRVLDKGRFQGSFAPHALAMTPVHGSGQGFVWLEECKYGCSRYGRLILPGGPQADVVILDDLPIEDEYVDDFRRWQIGYDPTDETFLLIWEDGRDGRDYFEPGLSIRGQRFRRDGSFVGGPIQIARHPREAWQAHMVYQPERREYLIVYREGKRLKGRFVRAGKRWPEFRLPGSRHSLLPSVAYSPQRNRYLVTWVRQTEHHSDIYGLWIRPSGKPIGKRFAISSLRGNQWVEKPGYSACDEAGSCLVTWIDSRDLSIRGKYLRAP